MGKLYMTLIMQLVDERDNFVDDQMWQIHTYQSAYEKESPSGKLPV